MKLKLEVRDGKTFLSISEGLTPEQVPVIKAGLNKLSQSGKKIVVLELTALPQAHLCDEKTRAQLLSLPPWAQEIGLELSINGLEDGTAPSQIEAPAPASTYPDTPLGRLQATEATLTSEFKKLEAQKNDFNRKMEAMASGEKEIKDLQLQNSRIQRLIVFLEGELKRLSKKRKDPISSEALASQLDAVQKTLKSVLEREGVLSAK